jgi:lipopolysaccharide transport protein LptA/LPS export ABC transporter protein LptC
MKWQRIVRYAIAIAAIVFAVFVARNFKGRTPPKTEPPMPRQDPTAIVESEGGNTVRISGSRESGTLEYERLLTYANGATKMVGVTMRSERDGKTFVVTGKEGQAGENETTVELTGGVRLESSDGMVLTTERATYAKAENFIRAPGPVSFARGRMTGSGFGLDYDQANDVLSIGDRAVVDVSADDQGNGAMSLAAGALEFRRVEKIVKLDRGARITRDRDVIEADLALAHLSSDEEHLELLELRTNSRITSAATGPGQLERLAGRNIDLRYAGENSTLQRAAIDGEALIQLAGEARQPGRQISANALNIGLAGDGVTPADLVARDNVKLTLPAEQGGTTRTIAAQALDSTGSGPKGLTGVRFTGNVQFSEKGAGVDRAARSAVLEAALAPGFADIQDATFTRGVRFADGPMFATAATAKYGLSRGVLELSGSEPGSVTPHVLNEQISVDAARVEITLEGPIVQATGSVKSVLQPKKANSAADPAHLPAMLKQDQPVNVTAERLAYDGASSRAVYTGGVLLWQGETSIKGSSVTLDSKSGDMSAAGPVTTSGVLLQDDDKGGKEKVSSVGTAKTFDYVDSVRRATYTGEAHIIGPQGDLTSPRVELFLKPSGDELERAEAYESVTLRGDGRKTSGVRLTYFGEEQRYLVTGAPVTIVDECGRETTGRTLTFFKAADRIVVDGNEQIRTQTRGKSNCP